MVVANYTLLEMRVRFRILFSLCGLMCLLFTSGCGGVHAEKGFSPLSILMPALLRYEPEKPLPPAAEPAQKEQDTLTSTEDTTA